MSFSGTVSRESHEGGLLVSFEGRAPRLGAGIRVVGGKTLGRVETVLGPFDDSLVHVHPLNEGIEAGSAIGSPVEIAPRGRVNRSRHDRRPSESKFRRGRDSRPGSRRGNDQRGRDRKFGGDRGSNMKPGDWRCPKCKNHNFANKKVCNRTGCEEPKPRGGGGRGRDSRGHRSSNSSGFRDSDMKPGDWNCPKCKNHNYAKRTVCNRCDTRKPVEGKGSRKTQGRQRRPNPRGNWKGKGRPRSRRDGRGR